MKTLQIDFSQKEGCTSTFSEACEADNKVTCRYCFDPVTGDPAYILVNDKQTYYLHKSCADVPAQIQHPLHPHHPLTLHRGSAFVCDGCSHLSVGFKYRCKECQFKLDVRCASKIEDQVRKPRVETYSIYHRHKLQLVSCLPKFSTLWTCCCCRKSIRNPSYICMTCSARKDQFVIHKYCFDKLSRQVQSSFHPEHTLFVHCIRRAFLRAPTCSACGDLIQGVALTCGECRVQFHVSCGRRTRPGLRFGLHHHQMHYVKSVEQSQCLEIMFSQARICSICQDSCNRTAYYRCLKCDLNVHCKCVSLAEIVEHGSHHHPLKLLDSIVSDRDDDEYRCDVCEDEGDLTHHSYYCHDCNYIAHIECVYPDLQDKAEDSQEETEIAEIKNDYETDTGDNDEVDKESDDVDKTEDVSQEEDESEDDSIVSSDSSIYSGRTSEVDANIREIGRRLEELALRIESDAKLDTENLKTEMVGLVFQLDDLRGKCRKLSSF